MCRVLPLDPIITQEYSSTHKGVDIVGNSGGIHVTCDVLAHSNGTVVNLATGHKNNKGSTGTASYGNYIKIQHENGMYTLYAHLNSVDVKLGDHVSQGDVIGYMGNTGNSYGAHLHFEVRTVNNDRIDPTLYLDDDLPYSSDATVSYQAYAKNKWWSVIVDYNNTNTKGYAGVKNYPLTGLYATSSVGILHLRAHQVDGNRWLPWVQNNSDYAGNLGKDIDMIQAYLSNTDEYAVEYRVSNPGRGYWDWIRNCDNPKPTLQYAGVPNKRIDRVQFRIVKI